MSASVREFRRVHWLSGVIGLLLVLAGIGVVLSPTIAGAIPLTEALLAPIAVIGLLLGAWRIRVRYRTNPRHVEVPVPEVPFAMPTPGDDLDDLVYGYTERGEGTLEYPERIGERLRELAIAAIVDRENVTRDEAIDRLEAGSWTENTLAAAYFSPSINAPEPSFRERVARLFGRGEHPYRRQIRETVDSIVAVTDVVEIAPPEPDEDPSILDRLGLTGSGVADGGTAVSPERTAVNRFDPDEGEQVTESVRYHQTIWTNRWLGIDAFALIAGTIGVIAVRPGLLVVAGVAVVYAAYSHLESPPSLHGLQIERTVDDPHPAPGERVQVTVTVENAGSTYLPDVRIVDLVPPNMRVVDGSPRVVTALRPGSRLYLEYTLVAERGSHEWPVLAVGGGFSGAFEREAVITAAGDDATIECLPRLKTVADVPVRMQTTIFEGSVETDQGGSGLEFHSVRDYQPNDPMRRVDWKRFARTGELTTIDMRVERAANVVLLFDAREGAYVSHEPGAPHALDRAVTAANDVYAALSDGGHLVGVAAFDTVPCWQRPNAGSAHDEAVRRVLAFHPALASLPPELQDVEGGYVDPMNHIRRQLPSSAQVMLFSPLVSDYAAEVARQLDYAGHRVTVISPDPTNVRTPGQRLGRVERALRINRVRESGIRVIDWPMESSLALTFERAQRRRVEP